MMTVKQNRIKVMYVLNDFLVGGVQHQFIKQLRYLDHKRFEVILVTLFYFPDLNNIYHLIPANIGVLKLNFKNLRDFRSYLSFVKVLKKEKPDIVVSSLFFSNFLTRLFKPFFSYKLISRIHNTYSNQTKIQTLCNKLLWRFSDKLVAVSKGVAEYTSREELIPLSKFMVINNGIDLDDTRAKIKKIKPLSEIEKKQKFNCESILLNVGRLTTQKNHDLLVESFALYASDLNYSLVILGEGGLLDRLNTKVKELGMSNRIFFLGNVSDVNKYYISAKYLISTSYIEGMSNVFLEAVAHGLPLLTTKTAGTDEIVKPRINGFFIEDWTIDSVIKGMKEMESLNFSQDTVISSIQSLDIKNVVSQYEELFNNLYASINKTTN